MGKVASPGHDGRSIYSSGWAWRWRLSRWGHIGATWRIRLNHQPAVAMRPCQWLWPLVINYTLLSFFGNST